MNKQTKVSPNEQSFIIMTLILSEQQSQKFIRIAKGKGIRAGIIVLGEGTVNSATLNLLGIKSQKKEIVNILLEKSKARETLDFFTKELRLHEPGRGIIFTSPVIIAGTITGGKSPSRKIGNSLEEKSMYKKLTVVVNRGIAEDVMDIARKSGVRGGTILHGRGTGSEYATKLFGVEIEPEKELVMIVMPSELIETVVDSLFHELQLNTPGNGILFVEPILKIRGLFDSRKDNKDG